MAFAARSTDFIMDFLFSQFETVWYFYTIDWAISRTVPTKMDEKIFISFIPFGLYEIFFFSFFLHLNGKNHHLAKFVLFHRRRSVSFRFFLHLS